MTNQESLNFYTTESVYAETFYQLPKVLFTSEKYRYISNDAKIAFALLKDRFNLSVQNNWVDEEKRIFFEFTTKNLQEILQCGNQKVIKIKKELEDAGLLFQQKMGMTYDKKLGRQVNRPNRLYLLQPEVTAQDVYIQTHGEKVSNGSVKITPPSKANHSNVSSGSVKITPPSKVNHTNGSNGSVKITQELDLHPLDTSLDTILDSKKAEQRQAELLKIFAEDNSEKQALNSKTKELIALFSDDVVEAEATTGIILRAKKEIEKETDTVIIIEHYEDEIEQTLRRVYKVLFTDEKIKSRDNYIYGTMKGLFNDIALSLTDTEDAANFIQVPIDDDFFA